MEWRSDNKFPASFILFFVFGAIFLGEHLPTIIGFLGNHYNAINPNRIWVIELGKYIILIGSTLALLTLFSKRYKIIAWGWAFFYGMIFFVPFTADWTATELSRIVDRIDILFAGYKYAYLPLVGIYIAIATSLVIAMRQSKQSRVIIIALVGGLLIFRSAEFIKLDKNWYLERSIRDKSGLEVMVSRLPKDATPEKPIIVLATGKHNPLALTSGGHYPLHAFYDESVAHMYINEPEFEKAQETFSQARAYKFNWDEERKSFD